MSESRRRAGLWATCLVAAGCLTGCSAFQPESPGTPAVGKSRPATGTTIAAEPSAASAAGDTTSVVTTTVVEAAVREYSNALLSGHAKSAWMMRTPRARSKSSYAAFFGQTNKIAEVYGDASIVSVNIALNGQTALATYSYDTGEIDQQNQPWVLVGQTWMLDK